MYDATSLLILSAAALAGLAILAGFCAWSFRAWLALKRDELAASGRGPVAGRIELADLRERMRKLEAIAAGVDV